MALRDARRPAANGSVHVARLRSSTRAFRESAARPSLIAYAALWYLVIFTQDYKFASIPLKVPLVALALGIWFAQRRTLRFAFTVPVLIVALVIPAVWFGIAESRAVTPPTGSVTSFAAAHGSHLMYLLLYFPIVDAARRLSPGRAMAAWLAPIVILCLATLGVWAAHVVFGAEYDDGTEIWLFKGVIGTLPSGEFRVQFGNHILLVPAVAAVMGRIMSRGFESLTLAVLATLVMTSYVSHTRGIWLGIMIAIVFQLAPVGGFRSTKRAFKATTAAIVTFALIALSYSAVRFIRESPDLSTALRYDQVHELLRGWQDHPVLGSGLGATLPDGFYRDLAAPWSFELTYLQILFQMGIVGFVLMLALPAAAIARWWRFVPRLAPPGLIEAQAGIGGLIGILVASGTNPYLMSSFGMIALVVTLVMVERPTAAAEAR